MAAIETLAEFFAWTDAGIGRKRIRCARCGAGFELRLMDDILEASCPSCGRGPFFERARALEAEHGAEEIARALVRLGILTEDEAKAAAEVRDPAAAASASDETAGFVGAARALGLFSKSLYLAVDGEASAGEPFFRARPLRELVAPAELREAVEIERREGTPVGEVIARLALAAQKEALLAALGAAADVDLDKIAPPREALDRVPASVAASYLAIPLALEPAGREPAAPGQAASGEQRLAVAVRDPLDFDELDRLELAIGLDTRALRASEDALFRALERLYPERDVAAEAAGPLGAQGASEAERRAIEREAGGAAGSEEETPEGDEDLFQGSGEVPGEPPGVRTLNLLLLQAAEERADHLILEPLDDAYRVRVRRGGRLRDAGRLPREVGEAAIERAMVLAGMDLSRRSAPQAGLMRFTLGGDTLEIEAALAPAALGSSLALAMRDGGFRLLPFDGLGLVPGDGRELRSLFSLRPGLTVIAAPRGEGRTTLLYSLLREVDRRRDYVVSLERTIRARVEGATQIALSDYASLAPALGRMRPDWLFIDDLLPSGGLLGSRDEARLALDLALGGTRVVAAVEAPDAVAALARLASTGIEASVLLSPLRALVALRLVKRVCQRCREDFEADPELAAELGLPEGSAGRRLAVGIGCWECGASGYSGRSALVEVIPVGVAMRERVRTFDVGAVRALASERGVRPIAEKALLALRAGLTSIAEIEPIVRAR
jgi:type II secretory ATPase GspE/PulE/Tfp pilus assembly ATPase PilB-like protein